MRRLLRMLLRKLHPIALPGFTPRRPLPPPDIPAGLAQGVCDELDERASAWWADLEKLRRRAVDLACSEASATVEAAALEVIRSQVRLWWALKRGQTTGMVACCFGCAMCATAPSLRDLQSASPPLPPPPCLISPVQLEEAAVAAREAATMSLLRELEAEEAQRAKKVRAVSHAACACL